MTEKPGRARCRACESQMLLQSFFGHYRCGSSDPDWKGDDKVKILSVELEEDDGNI